MCFSTVLSSLDNLIFEGLENGSLGKLRKPEQR